VVAVRNPLGPAVSRRGLSGVQVSTLDDAQAWLGHRFARPDLLAEALTHRSAAGARGKGSNERLEFIGDRVLGLVVAEWMIEKFAKRLAVLVSKATLAGLAEAQGLGAFLTISRGEARRGVSGQAAVLADGLEAVIGALYLDSGLGEARAFVRRIMAAALEQQAKPPKDSKTALQEWALKRALELPAYVTETESGPSHHPRFVVRVSVGDAVARGEAGTKRAAEQAAAAALLGMLNS
jgi:ribonuclease-3